MAGCLTNRCWCTNDEDKIYRHGESDQCTELCSLGDGTEVANNGRGDCRHHYFVHDLPESRISACSTP